MLSRLRLGTPRGGDFWHVAALLLLVGLVASALATATDGAGYAGQIPIEVVPMPGATGADADALQIRFELPPVQRGDPPWVVWVPRVARDAVWIEAYGWRSPERSFYVPDPVEGVLPGGYAFVLPRRWEGLVEATLHVLPAAGTPLQPRVMSIAGAARLQQAAAAGSAAIYASLLMLSMLALSLYAAARDRVFLTLFACTGTLALMLAGLNGHLYALPGLRLLAHWRVGGLWALVFVFLASWVRLIQQYVWATDPPATLARGANITFWSLLGAAGVCLAGLGLPEVVWRHVSFASWVIVGAGSLVLLVGAGRRGVAMAWPLVVLLLMVFAVSTMLGLLVEVERLGPLLTRLLYQGGLVLFLTICAVGLVLRISEYRAKCDRYQL